MPDWLQSGLANLASASMAAGVVGLYLARAQRKKIGAESNSLDATAAQTITNSAVTLIEQIKAEADAAKAEVHELRAEIEELRAENRRYRAAYGDPPTP